MPTLKRKYGGRTVPPRLALTLLYGDDPCVFSRRTVEGMVVVVRFDYHLLCTRYSIPKSRGETYMSDLKTWAGLTYFRREGKHAEAHFLLPRDK